MNFQGSRVFIVLWILFVSNALLAQNTSITVVNANTQEKISFAEIILNKTDGSFIKGITTDANGIARFNLDQRAQYQITFMGFETREGSINPGEHLTLELSEQYDLLDDVVVTGQYAPKKADQSIYKIDVVDSRQMEQRGVNNLAEALSQETNIRLKTDPATGTSIELQGMGGENVKYLIDGVPIVGRVGGDVDLSQINMDNVDHVEIVQGPMSVVYGTSALAGVINIITKKNTSNRNILKVNGYADTKKNYNLGFYGSMIRGKHTLTLSGSRNMFQGQDIDLNVDHTHENGKDRYMEFKPKLVYNGDLGYAYTHGDFRIEAKTAIMNSELRNYANPNPFTLIAYDSYYHTLRSINSLNVSDKLSKNLSYNIVGAYTYFDRETENIKSDLSELTHVKTGSTSTTFHNLMTRGSFILAPESSKLNYQFGWDINYDKGTGERIDEEQAQMTDYAAFASAQWKPLESLSIQPGLRFIYNTSFDAPIIPSINVQWKIIKDLNLRVSYAKGFRAPSLKELYLDFQDVNHNLKGNPDLKAETTNSYNGSLTYKFKREKYYIKLEPAVFYNDGKDVITLIVTDPQANEAQTTNLGGRKTLGTNINLSFVQYSGLTLSAGYSLTGESYDYLSEGIWTDQVYYDNYTFNAKYNFKKYKMILMGNYKYYGKTPSLFPLPDHPGEFYNVYTEAFSDLEISVSKRFFNDKLNVVAGGKNLFDNYSSRSYGYLDGSEFLSPINYGRTYFIKAVYRLTK